MGWTKHEDAVAQVWGLYDKSRAILESATYRKKLTSPTKIAQVTDDYLVGCHTVGRAVDHDLVDAVLVTISHISTALSWNIKH